MNQIANNAISFIAGGVIVLAFLTWSPCAEARVVLVEKPPCTDSISSSVDMLNAIDGFMAIMEEGIRVNHINDLKIRASAADIIGAMRKQMQEVYRKPMSMKEYYGEGVEPDEDF